MDFRRPERAAPRPDGLSEGDPREFVLHPPPTPAGPGEDTYFDYYVRLVSNRKSLRGSLAFYRAWDETVAQNAQRKNRPLTMPVLAVGGAASWGELVPNAMKELANDVQGVVIPRTGHWLAEESPKRLSAALTPFLAPYRDGSAAASTSRSPAAAASLSVG